MREGWKLLNFPKQIWKNTGSAIHSGKIKIHLQDNRQKDRMEHIESDIEYKEEEWKDVLSSLEKRFGKKPDLQSIIFLVGHRELGKLQTKFSKEQKQDMIHVGVCTLLSKANYYTFLDHDQDGWPHFEYNRD